MEQVAVVSGGTGALGRAVVRELVERGWRVHVPWVVRAELEALQGELGGAMDAVTALEADLTDAAAAEAVLANVDRSHGRLDALCGLVGGFAGGTVEATDPATWRRMIDLNATTAFLAARAAVPRLRRSGGGRIVLVGSAPGLEGAARMAAYAASKAAVVGLTRSLAKELRPDRITVNAVAPTTLDTEANRAAMPEADRSRWLRPDEVARVVGFLVSPDAAVVTGSVLRLDR